MSKPLGIFTEFNDLSATEQELVRLAWKAAESSALHQLCFQSKFPVGAAILAANDTGCAKVFLGCNVENDFFPPAICAERGAVMAAVVEGYTRFLSIAVVCQKVPGGSPCGLCRQVLRQFGLDAVLLSVVDQESNVRRSTSGELLPAASGAPLSCSTLSPCDQRMVRRLVALKSRSHVPYSRKPRAALFIADNARGKQAVFSGVSDDNASFGGSALAESVAMRAARTAGYSKAVRLMVTVEDPAGINPIAGECLQVLREFGAEAPVWLVGQDSSTVISSLEELLPDSFGPESL